MKKKLIALLRKLIPFRRKLIRWQRWAYIKELIKEADSHWIDDGRQRIVLKSIEGPYIVVDSTYMFRYNKMAKKTKARQLNHYDILKMMIYKTPEGTNGKRKIDIKARKKQIKEARRKFYGKQ